MRPCQGRDRGFESRRDRNETTLRIHTKLFSFYHRPLLERLSLCPSLRDRQVQTFAIPVLLHPGKVWIVHRRGTASFVEQIAGKIIEEVHVGARRCGGGMKAFCNQHGLAMPDRE